LRGKSRRIKRTTSTYNNLSLFYQKARTTFLGEELLVLVGAIDDPDAAYKDHDPA
jgi:hypothetical protein